MSHQRPFPVFSLKGGLFKLLSALLQRWPIMLLTAFFISPVGPHLRWSYTYNGAYDRITYLSCTYLGSRGFVTPYEIDDCPAVIWFDAREGW